MCMLSHNYEMSKQKMANTQNEVTAFAADSPVH